MKLLTILLFGILVAVFALFAMLAVISQPG